MELLETIARQLKPEPGPRSMPWPGAGQPHGFRVFPSYEEWKDYLSALALTEGVPPVVTLKFERALKLYLLGWIDADIIKAGELIALSSLELAVRDRYGREVADLMLKEKPPKSKPGKIIKTPVPSFGRLLDFMVTGDGLTDAMLPVVRQHGGSLTARLRFKDPIRPTFAEMRNGIAHGDPFDGFPHCGLLEGVRDIIAFAYRPRV